MKTLKDRMPRLYPDHRRTLPRRLRAVYRDLEVRFRLQDGVARRVALLAASSWLAYQDAALEANAMAARRRKGKVSADLSRLRRRQASAAGQFLAGLRSLEALAAGNGHGGLDLAKAIAQATRGDDR